MHMLIHHVSLSCMISGGALYSKCIKGEVDHECISLVLCMQAEKLLRESVLDRKQLRAIEEQLTQQLLALDKLEVAGDTRLARKVQINRINAWADRLETLH